VADLGDEASESAVSFGGTYAAIAAVERRRARADRWRGWLRSAALWAVPLLALGLAAVALVHVLAPEWRARRGSPSAAPSHASGPPPGAPHVIDASPVRAKTSIRVGEARDFAVVAAGSALRYAWTLDGRPAGTGPRWVYAADAGAVGRRRVEVTVTGAGGSVRRTWAVRVRPARPPRILGAEPDGASVTSAPGAALDLRLVAAPATPGEALRTTWTVDGRAAGDGERLTLRPERSGVLVVRAEVTGALGATARRDWRVIVAPPAAAPAVAPPPAAAAVRPAPPPAPTARHPPVAGPPAGPLRARAPAVTPAPPAAGEEEVRRSLARYAAAWRAHDVHALRRMGQVTTDAEAAALRRYFASVRDLDVELNVIAIRHERGRTLVTFTRRDRFRDPAGRLVMKESPLIDKQVVRTSDGLRFVRPELAARPP
jgi:hypothetical protein